MLFIASSTEKGSVAFAVPTSDIDIDEHFRLMNTSPDKKKIVKIHKVWSDVQTQRSIL